MTAPDSSVAARAPSGTTEAAAPCRPQIRAGWRSQFASPRGLGGRFAGWLMARKNAAMNAACVDWLVLAPADRVLEIGFGHGRTLEWIAERAPSGSIAGVDPSHAMLRMATRRNRTAVQSGRVRLALGSAEALPFPDAHFDKLLAANCVQFWDLPRALAEARRVLRPGGTLLLGIRLRAPREGRFSSPGFSEAQVDSLLGPLARAGFANVRSERTLTGGREVLGLFAVR